MKPDNNHDKLKMIKLLIILNMLQQPNCFININKIPNKKLKNKNVKKNEKDKINTEFILSIQQVPIENGSVLIPPIQEVTFENDSESILSVCDKLGAAKILVILKRLQQSYYNENISKTFKNNSINVEYENAPNNLGVVRNAKEKFRTKYILPIQEVIIKDHTEYVKKKDKINPITNDIYRIDENIKNDYYENLISTLPIIISAINIDIPIESTFRLKNAAIDIKTMKKDVYLTNSTLLPMYEKDNIFSTLHGKLFLEGFVRNKLDFSIAKDVNNSVINLDTECVIIYIPFKCTTIIHYKVPPVFSKGKIPDYIPIYISSDSLNINNDFNEYLSKKNAQCRGYVNCDSSPINCEIKRAKINSAYTLLDKKPFSKDFPLEMDFNTIKENIIINLSLTLIQKQDIVINYKKGFK